MYSDISAWVQDEFEAGKPFSGGWEEMYYWMCNSQGK